MSRSSSFLLGTLVVLALSCGQPQLPPVRTNLVISVIFDTVRADRFGCYGNGDGLTPNVDAFAQDALLFENAMSLSAWTKPSVATVMTSLWPQDHLAGHFYSRVPETLTWPKVLQTAGFETRGITVNPNTSSVFHFDQGFDELRLWGSEKAMKSNSPEIYRETLAQIDPESRQFFHLHLIGSHGPYSPPAWAKGRTLDYAIEKIDEQQKAEDAADWVQFDSEEELEYLKKLYEAELFEEDQYFGEFIKALKERGWYESALIVLYSDHGEAFNEHGEMLHGNLLFKEETHVPILVKGPKIQPGKEDSVVGLHDIGPTVLDILGLEVPPEMRGVSMVRKIPEERFIPMMEFREVPTDSYWFGTIWKEKKAVWNRNRSREYLFEPWFDDELARSLREDHPQEFLQLVELYPTGLELTRDDEVNVPEEVLEQMRSLGYVSP